MTEDVLVLLRLTGPGPMPWTNARISDVVEFAIMKGFTVTEVTYERVTDERLAR